MVLDLMYRGSLSSSCWAMCLLNAKKCDRKDLGIYFAPLIKVVVLPLPGTAETTQDPCPSASHSKIAFWYAEGVKPSTKSKGLGEGLLFAGSGAVERWGVPSTISPSLGSSFCPFDTINPGIFEALLTRKATRFFLH